MGFDLVFTAVVLILAFAALFMDLWSPDAVLLTAVAVVTAGGVISLEQAVHGFGNTTLVALGALYVLAAALRDSGALEKAGTQILGKGTKNISRILARMCPSVGVYSAFLNNTPIVAMGIPAIRHWARENRVPASKLLMPLSFASILGGGCTLIGTSTNLITHGLLQDHGYEGLSFFELAWLGVPCMIVGLLYIIFISPKITPARKDIREEEEQERELMVELEIEEGAEVSGKTVKEAGLEEFPGFTLARINRDGMEIAPVSKNQKLRTGDHLFYRPKPGIAERVPDLTGYPGLRLVVQPPRKIEHGEERDRELHQVVVKEGSRLVGSTVEEAQLLRQFGAAVTGVRRGGKRIEEPLGDFVLQPGDVLLLDTRRGFRGAYESAKEFFLTSEAGGEEPGEAEPEEERTGGKDLYISVAVLVGIITTVTLGFMHIALAGILGVAILLGSNIIEPGEARKAVDWSVLIVIGAALGLGKAMEESGLAELIANQVVDIMKVFGPRAVLGGLIVTTAIMTQIITNNGAIALMFPIGLSVIHGEELGARAVFIGMTLAASMSFLTPIGYQTNLMVYGPGNYRFADFFKVGAPLQVLLWIVMIIVAPMLWPV